MKNVKKGMNFILIYPSSIQNSVFTFFFYHFINFFQEQLFSGENRFYLFVLQIETNSFFNVIEVQSFYLSYKNPGKYPE